LTRDDKADPRRARVRELADFERRIVRRCVEESSWLPRHDESAIRWALSLARISEVVVPGAPADEAVVEVGHATDAFRTKLHDLLAPYIGDGGAIKREAIRAQIPKVRELAAKERRELVRLFGGRLPQSALDRAVRRRPLALALGGGGGTGYVFIGAMLVLDEAGLVPDVIAGTSMGAILGAFRARKRSFALTEMKQLIARLSWRRIFRVLEGGSRFGVPATLKLFLREVIGHEFEKDGGFMNLNDLEVPLRVTVAGITQVEGQREEDFDRYAHLLDDVVIDVRKLRRRARAVGRAMVELTRRPLKAIYLGADELTEDFDVLDAIGFSSAVPGVIHYDILRDDPRMISLVTQLMKREGVARFVDGGWVDNLPAQEAARAITDGVVEQRDPFVLALDGFAPNFRRNILFLPLMRLGEANSRRGRDVADFTLRFENVLSPLSVVPTPEDFLRAVANGRAEMAPHVPFVRKMVGPIPDPPGIITELDEGS
jgi:predicted acylesterase/phospholipase RssA